MKVLIIIFSIVFYKATASIFDEWTMFKTSHGKRYNKAEEEYRLNVFLGNKKFIEEHNENYRKGLVGYEMKLNRFGDLTPDEFTTLMNGYNSTGQAPLLASYFSVEGAAAPAAASIDWREKGAVTPVKDQGMCGSCWSFSATGSLEGQVFLKTGKLVSLSEQNLIDCSKGYGNDGCQGGLMINAFRYVKDNHGLNTERAYPYEGIESGCRFQKQNIGGTINKFINIREGDEDALKLAVANIGPISVAIDAGLKSFQFYSKGVYSDESCGREAVNHAVLLVGYGTENGSDYWLIKNSWNTVWGDSGFVKIARNINMCGIANMASYPVV